MYLNQFIIYGKTKKVPRRGRLSNKFESIIQGKLSQLIKHVASDDRLDLQVRDNYFNVYFEGGNVMKISEKQFSFDPWYFYEGIYQGEKIPKTYIEEQAEGKNNRTTIPANYPSEELAKKITKEINEKADSLIAEANAHNFKSYFDIATDQVSKWVVAYKRDERKAQHYIACSNRRFSDLNDLVVIDLEFAVSTLKPYNKAKNTKDNQKVPKFDIIAVDKEGQLYSIELKNDLNADKEGSAQDVKHHLEDFKNTIGRPVYECDFTQEMKEVLVLKQKLGILGKDIFIDTARCPKFAIAYSGKNESDKTKFKQKHPKLMHIKIQDNGDNKLYLKFS